MTFRTEIIGDATLYMGDCRDVMPTLGPVNLCQLYIENSTKRGGVVLDPFMGSGTTGVAAIRSGHRFVGIELTQQWFDVACKRIEAAMAEPRLFSEPEPKAVQTSMFGDAA